MPCKSDGNVAICEELMSLLEQKICDPCLNLLNHENENRIIQTIISLVSKIKLNRPRKLLFLYKIC